MDIPELFASAETEDTAKRRRWTPYAPVVRTLRRKGFSYQQWFDWLIKHGEPLQQPQFNSFRAALGASEYRALKKAAKS